MFNFGRDRYIENFIKKAAAFAPSEIKKYEDLYNRLQDKAKPVKPKKLGLKLLVISDTHGDLALDRYRFPNYLDTIGDFDLCIMLGDVHPAEMPLILDCVSCEKIIGVKGNHDTFSIYNDHGVRDVSGEVFKYKGVSFAGIDGCFRYKDAAFPSHSQYESLLISRDLAATDVLITHDVMLKDFNCEPAHSGLMGISHYIFTNHPQWHFHGHIHKSYESRYLNGTKEKSVYMLEYIEV